MTTLLLNGRVHSPAMPDATAMAVRDGVVAWLGSDDVGRAQFPGAEIVDLDGAFVAPAFVGHTVRYPPSAVGSTAVILRIAVLAVDGTPGATVVDVGPGTPAAGAGLQVGDVIVALDNTQIGDPDDLSEAIGAKKPGDRATVTDTRSGQRRTAQVNLGTRPTG